MGELHQAGDLNLGLADKLVLGQPTSVDLTEQSSNLFVQLQQLSAVSLIGLQALCQLVQRKLRLCQRHLKWVSRCATMSGPAGTRPVFVPEERMDEIKTLVERMEQDGEIPLG